MAILYNTDTNIINDTRYSTKFVLQKHNSSYVLKVSQYKNIEVQGYK